MPRLADARFRPMARRLRSRLEAVKAPAAPSRSWVLRKGQSVVLATAAAALKTLGGWDETVPISIDVGGKTIEVRLIRDGSEWIADVREA